MLRELVALNPEGAASFTIILAGRQEKTSRGKRYLDRDREKGPSHRRDNETGRESVVNLIERYYQRNQGR